MSLNRTSGLEKPRDLTDWLQWALCGPTAFRRELADGCLSAFGAQAVEADVPTDSPRATSDPEWKSPPGASTPWPEDAALIPR
jgi:hypothetical protein